MKTVTKIDKVYRALEKKPLTALQIQKRFGVSNVSAVIYDMRRRGNTIVTTDDTPVRYAAA